MVLDACSIYRLDRLEDLPIIQPSVLGIQAARVGEQIGLLGHARQSMASHDVRIVQFFPLKIVLYGSHVLVQKALLDACLDLRDDRARVDVEVLTWRLAQTLLSRKGGVLPSGQPEMRSDSTHDGVPLLRVLELSELIGIEQLVDGADHAVHLRDMPLDSLRHL